MWALLLSRTDDPPDSFFDRRQLDSGQIKVGRNEKTCDVVLPDSTGFVSREHCTISASGLDVYVTDTSKNGVCLNDPSARIAAGQPVPVRARDRLLIHDFVITLVSAAEASGIGLAPPPPAALPGAPAFEKGDGNWFDPPADPFWSGTGDGIGGAMGGIGGDREVHDFLNNLMPDMSPPSFEPMGGNKPSDFGFGDPFGDAFSRPIMAEPLPPPSDFGIPADWADVVGSSSFPAPNPFEAAPAFPPLPEPNFGTPPPVQPPAQQFAPPPPPAQAFAPPPQAAPAPPPPRPAAPAARGRGAPAGPPDAAWDAFFEGAGLTPEELYLPPDAMYRLGVLYRQVVLGLCDVLQDRAAFKEEFRVERTQLSIGQNNPLKHLPAIDAAKILLGQPLPGFMPMEDAVRTSFEDVKRHQLAMLAGVQQALAVAFDRLSPREVEKLVEKAEAEKKGFLRLRGVDRWSVYVTLFEALRRDATSNANGVMSVAFRDGYEKFMKSSAR